jgi:hypothetical protein
MLSTDKAVANLVNDFVNRLSVAIRAEVAAEVQARVIEAIGDTGRRGPGRPPGSGRVAFGGLARNALPKQLCPVPGCKNPAAPVFRMLCADHKDTPKAKVAEYRAARHKAKLAERASAKLAARKARGAGPVPASAKPIRKGPPSPARRLQGKYLGALRSLKGEARARVKAVANEKSVAEALKLALSLKKAKSAAK